MRVPATPAPLDEVLAALQALPPRSGEHPPYLEVRVRLEAPEPGLRARIEAALEGRHARLARIDTSLPQRDASNEADALSLDQIGSLRPDDIFRRLYRQKFDCDAPDDQLAAFTELMTAASIGPSA
jgi:exonuclease SbcD